MKKSEDEFHQVGEDGEAQASELSLALATIGDEEFSKALSNQTQKVQRIVIWQIDTLLESKDLSYPMTYAIALKYHADPYIFRY